MNEPQRPRFPARLDLGGKPAAQAPTASARPRPAPAPGAAPPAWPPGFALPTVSGDRAAPRQRLLQLLAQQGVQDLAVLTAMGKVERHRFIDPALEGQAYEDTSLPIGLGQTISKPGVVARMLSLLREGHSGRLGRVLEIGTGCGYQAAVLSELATEVYSMERLRAMHDKARENLRTLRIPNIHLLMGDGNLGYPQGAPYAAIISAAGGDAIPQTWLAQLAVGGRLVAPTVTGPGTQSLMVVERTPQGFTQRVLEAVLFVPLKSGVA
ncbi:protein-L-isoaspartate O-methyltransferase [Comamonas serinivorans]|uniref:Protein-L-isoaspartate O-methyltransferase n=1 Tax=Comamonas serinivorans TaxID=1082851 RepID=A0A1Y0EQ11_9BURK|nr:protein-L-isoaspartate(D-aspartate) O-methyltransferase [Comamonas serinivorans]ARU05666.1 protein-L-isoaspartate O-methyltransferase [Comamonas serinivorans]